MSDSTTSGLVALVAGGFGLVAVVAFHAIAHYRRGTLTAQSELPFVLGLLALFAVLTVAVLGGPSTALVVPPAVLLGGGAYLVATPNRVLRWGISTRVVGALIGVSGSIALVGGLIRLATQHG